MNVWLLAVPAIPLAVALAIRVLPLTGRWPGWASISASGAALACLVALPQGRLGLTWFRVRDVSVELSLVADPLSRFVGLLVGVVVLLVAIYSVGYLWSEAHRKTFFFWLTFFEATMLALVLAGSFPLLFAAWELVGLCSWRLIGFYDTETESRHAAQKAFLMTRLGDLGFLLAWLWIMTRLHTTDISLFLSGVEAGTLAPVSLSLLAFLFLAAAAGKSAQLPLTAWLPDAMAGPTPVSALLHSATMVAAGVYLILRLFPLFEAAPAILSVVLGLGGLTALAAGLIATSQYDLKRILAWSTVSQLGEMMIALGLAAPVAALFHLSTHAFFKSTLFLCAGIVDEATGERDLREISGLARKLPLTGIAFLAAGLALAGFPLLSGYWSEEMILAQSVRAGWQWGLLLLALIFLAGAYIGRAGSRVFSGDASHDPEPKPAGRRLMVVPALVLAALAAGAGLFLKGRLPSLGSGQHAEPAGLVWTAGAVAASLAGLSLGFLRVRRAGPAPVAGAWPSVLATVVHGIAGFPVSAVRLLSEIVGWSERGFDGGAQILVSLISSLAARGVMPGEKAFDWAGRRAAGFSEVWARGVDQAERGIWDEGGAGLGQNLREAGGRLRKLESGKIFLYAMGLFIWAVVTGVGALLVGVFG